MSPSNDRAPNANTEAQTKVDTAVTAASNGQHANDLTSWWPIDLSTVVAGLQAGEIVGPVPELMQRSDGACLLYPGEVHSLAGEPETGKGWIALATAALVIANGRNALYLDFEDAPASIVSRMLALGATPKAIVNQFSYVRPSDPFTGLALEALLAGKAYSVAVIDGLSEAYALLGLDPYSNLDAAKFLAKLPRPIGATGTAVLLIDHVVKAKDSRGRWALGAQHKLAGIAVAYSTDVITPPSRTTAGRIKLRVEKDRHGHVRSHAQAGVIAQVRITPEDDGDRVTVTLDPPEVTVNESGEFVPTHLMGRVSEFITDEPGATRNAIREAVKGRSEYVTQALQLLIDAGYIDRRHEGQSYRHYPLRPYESEPFPTVSHPGPGNSQGTVSTGSPPLRDPETGPGAGQQPTGSRSAPASPQTKAAATGAEDELERWVEKGL